MRDLTVTLIQDDISWQDPRANRLRNQKHVEAIAGETDLIVLPEMFSTGYYEQPRDTFETMQGETVAWMRESAAKCNAVITGSLIMKTGDKFVNRMIWAKPDGEMTWYDKRHLFRFGGEHHHYHSGDKRVIVDLDGWRVALFVCYDIRFPVWSRNRDDYDIAVYAANWPNARQYAWDSLLVARAIENQSYVIGVNRLGSNPNGDEYSGGSVILDYLGMPIESCKDRISVATTSLSMVDLQDNRAHFPASLDRDNFEITV
jgi:predicted amidohydrolase